MAALAFNRSAERSTELTPKAHVGASNIGLSYKPPQPAPNHPRNLTHDLANRTPADDDLYPSLGHPALTHRSSLPALHRSTRLFAALPRLVLAFHPSSRPWTHLSPFSAKKNEPPFGDSLLTLLYEMLS